MSLEARAPAIRSESLGPRELVRAQRQVNSQPWLELTIYYRFLPFRPAEPQTQALL